MNKELAVGDKLSPKDIEVGMIVSIVRKYPSELLHEDVTIQTKIPTRGFMHSGTKEFHNWGCFYVIYKGGVKPPTNNTQQQSPLDEQSIAEAVKTLSRASQELSTHLTVDGKGVVTVYSDYHEEDLMFDTAEKLMQYIECVKQMNSFVNK